MNLGVAVVLTFINMCFACCYSNKHVPDFIRAHPMCTNPSLSNIQVLKVLPHPNRLWTCQFACPEIDCVTNSSMLGINLIVEQLEPVWFGDCY